MHFHIINFSVNVIITPSSAPLFSMDGSQSILELKSDKSLFNPNASVIIADPFLFVKDDTLYLFYEHLTRWSGIGRICMRSTKDLHNWTDEIDVLSEPFHLSFPYVFEDDGKVYMLPETGSDKSISLYEAEDDSLTHWRLVKKLMEGGESWYDSVIFKKDNLYYLFTGHDNNVQQEQHLFVARNLFGPYDEHPMSPIYKGRDGGRNAGSIISDDGVLFRPVQVCLNSYGEQTSVMKIDSLMPDEYKETLYKKDIIDTKQNPYGWGGHQWNPVEFLGQRVVATDYREKNYNVIETIRKVKRRIFK